MREKAERRHELERQIGELAAERGRYLAEQRREAGEDAVGLDAATLKGIREEAATKGFSFAEAGE